MSANPVFVLCSGRSGLTLLRFLLDAHPDLACPPEMKLPPAVAYFITLWSDMEKLSSSSDPGNGAAGVPRRRCPGSGTPWT